MLHRGSAVPVVDSYLDKTSIWYQRRHLDRANYEKVRLLISLYRLFNYVAFSLSNFFLSFLGTKLKSVVV